MEIDRVDARSWRRHALRGRLALVRSGEIFGGTVFDNVGCGRPAIGPIEAQRALERVGAWPAIAAAPDGLARVLRSGGAPLPPGIALLVVLARALAGDSRILLVDSLADLDPAQRAHTLSLLHDRTRPVSVLFVASDPALVGPCDRIYVIEAGQLVELDARDQGAAA
jgi:ABC-type multidrug transport system fused ATPase/permease subunit